MEWVRAGLPVAFGKCSNWLQYRISTANIGAVCQTNFHVSRPAYACKCCTVAP